ncbi:MAG TPA: ABC transporter permease [Miltoncostaeaceae bacterium]|nr:ABC transporter permease [Miltoncostaeaceae bacterium]
MNTDVRASPRDGMLVETGKVLAFLRRDLLVAWSYRVDFASDIFGMAVQVFMFYFIGLMVDPSRLPAFGGNTTSYLEFVALGIALSMFVALALRQVASALRDEQFQGTLECLLLTPSRALTIQLGAMAYEFVYVPIRTIVFLTAIGVGFGLDFHVSGFLPAAVVLMAVIPFVWGLGVAAAAAVLAFRRGEGAVAFLATILTVSSGAYFPLDLLPGWLQTAAEANPFAVALESMREAVLGGTGWSDVGQSMLLLVPMAAASLLVGYLLYNRALRRELRKGSLGDY